MSDAIYPYHVGGKEIRYHHLVEGLAASGVEVHVFTMQWWPGGAHRVEGGVSYHALCRRLPLYHGERRSILEAVVFAVACLRLVLHRFDLIDADHMPHLQLFTIRLVAWLRRVPLVVTWHELWGRAYWRTYLGRVGTLAAVVEWLSMRTGDEVVTPSPGTAERLVANGLPPGRVTVVPNGLDLEAIAAAPTSPEPTDLLFVGRLISHKHADLLLEAMTLLDARGTPLTLAIVGEGPERAALEAAAGRLGLNGRVRFIGNLGTQVEVYGRMKAARVFVLPSTREGFGIVVAEAIACGTPVVTTNHPDNRARELIDEGVTGFLCEPSAGSIADAVTAALARGTGGTPTAFLERLAWTSAVTSTLEVYDRAGARRRAAG